jgi:hypothetical protein
MEPRLKTALWVAAYLRRCMVENIPGVVARKGDETAGSVIVKVNLLDRRARVFVAAYDDAGERIWVSGLKDDPASEPDVDAYIARAISRDPDVWVVEIEDRKGEQRLDGI